MKKLFFVFLCSVIFVATFGMEQKVTGLAALIDFLNKFDAQNEWQYQGKILDLEEDLKELDKNQVAVYALGTFSYEYDFDVHFYDLSKFLRDSDDCYALFPFLLLRRQLFMRLSASLIGIENRAWWDTSSIKKYAQELNNSENVPALINKFWDTLKKDPLYKEYAYLVSKDDKPWDAIRKIWAFKNNEHGVPMPIPFLYDSYDLFKKDFAGSDMAAVIQGNENSVKELCDGISSFSSIAAKEASQGTLLSVLASQYKKAQQKSIGGQQGGAVLNEEQKQQLEAYRKKVEQAKQKLAGEEWAHQSKIDKFRNWYHSNTRSRSSSSLLKKVLFEVIANSLIAQPLMKSGNSWKKNVFLSSIVNGSISSFLYLYPSQKSIKDTLLHALLSTAGSLGFKYGIRERLYPKLISAFKSVAN